MESKRVKTTNPLLDAVVQLVSVAPDRSKPCREDNREIVIAIEITPTRELCAWSPTEIFWILDQGDPLQDIRKSNAAKLPSAVSVLDGKLCRSDDSYIRNGATLETRVVTSADITKLRLGYRYWTFPFSVDVPAG